MVSQRSEPHFTLVLITLGTGFFHRKLNPISVNKRLICGEKAALNIQENSGLSGMLI